jgi:hypothetical protein
MASVYLQRGAAGAIAGVYAKPTPGLAEEAADDTSAEVQAFLYPPDLSRYRRAGAGRRARQLADELERNPLKALAERATKRARDVIGEA